MAAEPEPDDPYELRASDVEAPPPTLAGAFRRIGPGMVLAAAIVGSGELIGRVSCRERVLFAV